MNRILVTGFEPFAGKKSNVSETALEGVKDLEGVQTAVLPVEFGRAGLMAAQLANYGNFDTVLALGERPGLLPAVHFEEQAHNRAYAGLISDNANHRRFFGRLDTEAPGTIKATLDYQDSAEALDEADIRYRFSRDAGRFVCNSLMFDLLNIQRKEGIDPTVRIGFAHMTTVMNNQTAQEAARRMVLALRDKS